MDIFVIFALGIVTAIATSLDEIIVLAMFHGSVAPGPEGRHRRRIIGLGYFLGSLFGVFIFAGIAVGLVQFPVQRYIFWLGLIPILMGIYSLIHTKDDSELQTAGSIIGRTRGSLAPLAQYIIIALVLSFDDFGVYIPLLAVMRTQEILMIIFAAVINVILVIYVSQRISNLAVVKRYLDKVAQWLIPVIFILIGLFVIINGYTAL